MCGFCFYPFSKTFSSPLGSKNVAGRKRVAIDAVAPVSLDIHYGDSWSRKRELPICAKNEALFLVERKSLGGKEKYINIARVHCSLERASTSVPGDGHESVRVHSTRASVDRDGNQYRDY